MNGTVQFSHYFFQAYIKIFFFLIFVLCLATLLNFSINPNISKVDFHGVLR